MGLNRTIMFACVTFETSMIVDPAEEYGANEIHLFHYVRPGAPDVYEEFYKEVVSQIGHRSPRMGIVEHCDSPVYDFQAMLREMLRTMREIREEQKGCQFLLNVSAGTSEFSAAAMVASFMCDDAVSFTVGTKEYSVPLEKIKELYYGRGKPIGLTKETYPPKVIPQFHVEPPDEELVRSLRIYSEMKDSAADTTASRVIERLEDEGLWSYVMDKERNATNVRQKRVMYFSRHYLEAWQSLGWLVRTSRRGIYNVTDQGKAVIDTFYVD